MTQASVHRPASTIFLRPVAATASRKFGSTQELMLVRSITSWSGNRSVTSGIKGPEKLSLATVEITVGKPNSLAPLARIWTLLNTDRRSWLSTP